MYNLTHIYDINRSLLRYVSKEKYTFLIPQFKMTF